MPQLAQISECTGCLACIDSCNAKALSFFINDEGHMTYSIDNDKCLDCHICEKVCPVVSHYEYGVNNLSLSVPYAGWATDKEIRKHGTSGAIFGALAKAVLDRGGLVVGASLEKNKVFHKIISKVDEIIKLQGSKYTQSNTTGIYNLVRDSLAEGKSVLFSGMGCQVSALLCYLKVNNNLTNLITVDIICGGVPSSFLISKYIEEYSSSVSEVKGFRNKSEYKFTVQTIDGLTSVVPLSQRPLPLCGFYTEHTNRYSCYDCKFATAHRKSDLTIGDLWGDKEYLEQNKEGVSAIVIHTQKGLDIISASDIEVHEIRWDSFLKNNPRMVYGISNLSKSKARRNLSRAFATYSYKRILEEYANMASIKQPIKMIRKIYYFLRAKIRRYSAVHEVNKLLKNNR